MSKDRLFKLRNKIIHLGCRETEVLRGRLRAVGEVQHVVPERDQLDGRARLKVEELGGAGGRKSQGSVGETRGKGYMITNDNINNIKHI